MGTKKIKLQAIRYSIPIVVFLLFGGVGIYFTFLSHASNTTLHYTANAGTDTAAAIADGFNVMDIAGSTSNPSTVKSTIDGLPRGTQALVWVGNLDNAPLGSTCPAPGFTLSQFQAQVQALASDSRVFGYFIADEPHPSVCPNAASDIKTRADYIHSVANGQKAFIVVLDGSNACGSTLGCEYHALRPAATDVDLIGLDPYPCHYSAQGNPVPCDLTQISSRVQAAESNGVPAGDIVPVFQEFGQEGRTGSGTVYYRTPSADELSSMLSTWKSLVPSPVMDYAYTWGTQCSASSCPAPQALSNHPELAAIAKAHNASSVSGTASSPSGGTGESTASNNSPRTPTSASSGSANSQESQGGGGAGTTSVSVPTQSTVGTSGGSPTNRPGTSYGERSTYQDKTSTLSGARDKGSTASHTIRSRIIATVSVLLVVSLFAVPYGLRLRHKRNTLSTILKR